MLSDPKPDHLEAESFLQYLAPFESEFCFQTFDDFAFPDGKKRRDSKLARVLTGTLEANWNELCRLNEAGAGIFVTVNETDGKGRNRENIKSTRAVWADLDDGIPDSFPLEPSIIVESSPGKEQRYWLCAGLAAEDHAAVLDRLVSDHKADNDAKGINRVLRLPGFYHQKGDPHLVRVTAASERRYSPAEILRAFPPLPVTKPASKPASGTAPLMDPDHPTAIDRARLFRLLAYIDATDRDTWLKAGMALHDASGGSEEGYELWCSWAPNAAGKFDESDQRRVWVSFKPRDKAVTVGTLYHLARQGGYREPQSSAHDDFEIVADAETPGEAPKTKPGAIVVLEAEDLLRTRAPPRQWLVPGWIPLPEVTLLGADGGAGKTTLAMQLACSSRHGEDWLGMNVNAGPVVYLSAEEPEDDLHVRLEQITAHMTGKADHKQFALISRAGEDATMIRFDRNGKLQRTKLYDQVRELALDRKARLIVLESAADIFDGDESNRWQVRTGIQEIRRLGLDCNAAVLLTAHPSVDGIKTGRGYSGSTHWNNAVRSRMYYTTPTNADGEEADPDLRCLTLAKANRGRPGEKLMLRWDNGVFVVDSPGVITEAGLEAKAIFLKLLTRYIAQGRYVSENFAPKEFQAEPEARGFKKAVLQKAMKALFAENKIENTTTGKGSKERRVIVPAGVKLNP